MKHSRPDYQHIQEHISPELKARLLHIFSGDPDMQNAVSAVIDSFRCRIPADEPVFLIRAQDRGAISTLTNYKGIVLAHSAHKHFSDHIGNVINTFRDWQKANPIKTPDLPAEVTEFEQRRDLMREAQDQSGLDTGPDQGIDLDQLEDRPE